jgi:peroxiredoxin
MRWKGLLLLLGGLIFGALIGWVIVQGGVIFPDNSSTNKPPEVGQPAPDFSLADLAGETVQLSQFRGKVVFLNFWATWCVPCRDEMPLLQEFTQEQGKDAVVVGVNLDEASSQVADFITQEQITFPILLDEDGIVASQYYIRGYPTTIVIDPNGRVLAIHIGTLTKTNLADYMEQAAGND